MFYSGIDLHKDMSFITTINEKGKIIAQQKLPNHNVHLLDYFDSIGQEHKAVVESTANWYWLSDLLNDRGIDLTLAHAKYLKAISYVKVKTDKVDSHTLPISSEWILSLKPTKSVRIYDLSEISCEPDSPWSRNTRAASIACTGSWENII